VTAALFVLGRRVLVGLAVGAVAVTLLSLVGTGRPWPGRFGIALVLVGCVNVLMAFSGHSPGMRLGTQDAYLASVFPRLSRRLGESYSRMHVSDSAVFVAAGVVLIAAGLVLV
jgi:hypothetical protein